jgi:hypothetical protein
VTDVGDGVTGLGGSLTDVGDGVTGPNGGGAGSISKYRGVSG